MTIRFFDDVIKGLQDESVKQNLENPSIRSFTYTDKLTIFESIENIIKNALRSIETSEGLNSENLKNSDTFIFPDVHGRLDLCIQNLFVANLIDKEGSWKSKEVNCIFLGDIISRGPYSTEALIYLQALKKQAEEKGSTFEILIGNHEHCLINECSDTFFNITNTDEVKKIINSAIKNNTFKLSYADNTKNILCVHAGVEKDILKWVIGNIKPETKERMKGKVSSQDIYKIMKESKISIEDVSNWMNSKFKEDTSLNAPLLIEHNPPGTPQGVINSRKKIHNKDEYDIDSNKLYKTTQFVGHTTTSFHKNLQKATFFGAIKKINHRFFLDYDLLRGHRAFVAISGNDIFQVYSTENGLSKRFAPLKQTINIPDKIHNKLGYYHGNTRVLDLSKWDVKKISKIPEVEKSDLENKSSGSKLREGSWLPSL